MATPENRLPHPSQLGNVTPQTPVANQLPHPSELLDGSWRQQNLTFTTEEQEERLGVPEEPVESGPGFFESVKGFFTSLGSPRNLDDVGKAIALGTLDQFILAPAEGISSIFGIEESRDFLIRARDGLYEPWEESAKISGMTDAEIAGVKGFGNLVGFTGAAFFTTGLVNTALKGYQVMRGGATVASLAPRLSRYKTLESVGEAANRFLPSKGFFTEMTGGALYGAVYVRPSDRESRANNALKEAAFFGGISIGMHAGGMLLSRAANYSLERTKGIRKILRQSADNIEINGVRPFSLGGDALDEGMSLLQSFSELEAVYSSPAAMQELLETGDPYTALLVGIRDAEMTKGMGIASIDLAGRAIDSVDELITRLRTEMPEFGFQLIKNPRTKEPHLFAAPRGNGLNNAQRSEFLKNGFYTGQRVFHDGGEGTVKRILKDGVEIIDGSGTKIKAKVDEVRIALSSADVTPLGQARQSLYQKFKKYAGDFFDEVYENSNYVSESDLRQLARSARLTLDNSGRMDKQIPGVISFPEQVGLAPDGNLPAVYQALVDAEQKLLELADDMKAAAAAGDEEFMAAIQNEAATQQQILDYYKPFTDAAVVEEIAENGLTYARLNDSFEDIPIGQVFDDFAADLVLEEGERVALKAAFTRKWADDTISSLPDETAEVVRSVARATEQLIGDMDEIPLEALGHMRGMKVYQSADTEKVVLRDILSGQDFIADSVDDARNLLRSVIRHSPDIVDNTLALRGSNFIPRFYDKEAPVIVLSRFEDYNMDGFVEDKFLWGWRPIDRLMKVIEERTNLPVHRLSAQVARNQARFAQEAETTRLAIHRIMKKPIKGFHNFEGLQRAWIKLGSEFDRNTLNGMKTEEIVDYLKTLDFVDDDMIKVVRAMDEAGVVLQDEFLELGGTSRDYWINHYSMTFARSVEPGERLSLDKFGLPGGRDKNQYVEWMLNEANDGKLSRNNLNPAVVIDSAIENVMIKRKIAPDLQTLQGVSNLTFAQLTPEQQIDYARATGKAMEDINPTDKVLSDSVRGVIDKFTEYHEYGKGKASYENITVMMQKFFKHMNIIIPDSVVRDLISVTSQLVYGSTLGWRTAPIILNSMQTTAVGMPLWGVTAFAEGVRRGLTKEGFERSGRAGAILPEKGARRFTEAKRADIEAIDEIANSINVDPDATGVGPQILRGLNVARKGFIGTLQKTGDVGLSWFGHIDEVNRSIAFHGQIARVQEVLARMDVTNVNDLLTNPARLKKFADDALTGHAPAVRQTFLDQWKAFGLEAAEDYIGAEGAKFTNFSYGQGLGPGYLQEGFGRLFGMFGSHPVWMADMTWNILKNSNVPQRAAFGARMTAYSGAMGLIGYEYGFNPMKFVPMSFPAWTGSPATQFTGDGMSFINSPWPNKIASGQYMVRNSYKLLIPGFIALDQQVRTLEKFGPPSEDNLKAWMIANTFTTPEPEPFLDYSMRSRFLSTPGQVAPAHPLDQMRTNPAYLIGRSENAPKPTTDDIFKLLPQGQRDNATRVRPSNNNASRQNQ